MGVAAYRVLVSLETKRSRFGAADLYAASRWHFSLVVVVRRVTSDKPAEAKPHSDSDE